MSIDWGGWDFNLGDPYGGGGFQYGGDPGLTASGGGGGGEQWFFDTQTGQTVSLQQAQQLDPTFQPTGGTTLNPTNYTGDPGYGTQTGQPGGGFFSNPQNLLTLGAIGLPTLLGLGGIAQGLFGGGSRATTINQPTQSPTAQAAQQAALQGFQGAQQYAFGNPLANLVSNATGQVQPGAGGLAGQLQSMAPYQQAASLQSLLGLLQQNNPFTQGYNPQPQMNWGQAPGMPSQQNWNQGQPWNGQQTYDPNTWGAGGQPPGAPTNPLMRTATGGVKGGTEGQQMSVVPAPPGVDPTAWATAAAVVEGYRRAGISPMFAEGSLEARYQGTSTPREPERPYTGPRWTNPTTGQTIFGNESPGPGWMQQGGGAATGGFQGGVPRFQGVGQGGGNPLLNLFAQQIQGYGGAQAPLLGLAGMGAMNLQNPAAGALGQQALGMAQGNLPALTPQLRTQVNEMFAGPRGDIARYLDEALRGTLERSRQQGFAGGAEVLREGTPAALFAPGLAEAQRQQGALSGLEAQALLGLAQSLPQQGGNLANQLFQQQLGQNQALQQAAGGYTTPLSVALGGGLNLSNLNQNIIQQLGAYGQQGMGNQLDFLRAISAPLSGLSGLAGSAQAGAGSTSTQSQPFNLLSAFAPTASLLGGIGGALTGYGAASGQYNPYGQNPATYRF